MTDSKTKFAKLNEQSQIAFRDWAKDNYKQDLSKVKRTDILISMGWTSTMFVSPKSAGSTATEASWEFAKNAINSGFPSAARDLITVSAKVAGDKTVNGQSRSYWMRQANAVLGDIKKQLGRREEIDADIASGKQGADATTRTPEAISISEIETIISRVQKLESFNVMGIELDDWIANLKELANQVQK